MHLFLVTSYLLTGVSYAFHAVAFWREVRGRPLSVDERLMLGSICSCGFCSQLMALSYLVL